MPDTKTDLIDRAETIDAIKRLGDGYEPQGYRTALRDAVEAIEQVDTFRAQTEEKPPLTLDELRGMDGEPVWTQFGDGVACWTIAAIDGEDVFLHNPDFDGLCCPDSDFYGMEYNDPAGHFGLHLLGWRAYRRKQEGAGNERRYTNA